MKKNRIFIAAGTFALAIVGFLTSNANNKKFVAATSAYYLRSGSVVTLFKGASTTNLTTTFATGKTAFFRTGTGGANVKLFAVKVSTSSLSNTAFVAH